MPFTQWKCEDCGHKGAVRHDNAVDPRIAGWIGAQHSVKSPACHAAYRRKMLANAEAEQARRAAMPETVRLSARDKHILITARIKRKLLAQALRAHRASDRAECRAQWLVMKKGRRGYAAT